MNEKEAQEMIGKRNGIVGAKLTLKSAKAGKVKAAILASNCPPSTKKKLKSASVEILKFRGSSRELGLACGKPFTVAVVGLR